MTTKLDELRPVRASIRDVRPVPDRRSGNSVATSIREVRLVGSFGAGRRYVHAEVEVGDRRLRVGTG